MKKNISVSVLILAIMLIISANSIVSACGHRNDKGTSSKYSVCTVEDCLKTILHTHNGKTYAAHYYGDGHKYHDYCNVEDCILTGYHEHDGIYCFSHTSNDGHNHSRSRHT